MLFHCLLKSSLISVVEALFPNHSYYLHWPMISVTSVWWITGFLSFGTKVWTREVSFIAFTISLSSSCLHNLVAKPEKLAQRMLATSSFIAVISPLLKQVPALHKQVPVWPLSQSQGVFLNIHNSGQGTLPVLTSTLASCALISKTGEYILNL